MNPFIPYVKHTLFLLFTLLFAFSSQGQAPAIEWQNSIGGSSDDFLYSIEPTSDGGYILGGHSQSSISGDKTENVMGYGDYWVVKLNSTGSIQWQNTIGGSSNDELNSIQETSDGGYILGGTSGSNISGDKTENTNGTNDYWVVKLDATGNIQWQNTMGGSNHDYLKSIHQTSDGGYILGGYSWSDISGDKTENTNGLHDYWVVKLNATGNIQWQNTIGGNNWDLLSEIDETSDGGYILGGYSESYTSGDKTEIPIGPCAPSCRRDYWVVKISSTGAIQWQNTIGGNDDDYLNSVQQTSDGGYILGGYSFSDISGDKTENSSGYKDYWVVKLNSAGNILWDNTLGGSGQEELNSIRQTSDGGYIVGGWSNSPISGDKTESSFGGTDYWVLKLSSSGMVEWDKTIGGSSNDKLQSIEEISPNTFILGGYSNSPISGNKTENSQGGTDYWVVKLAPPTEPAKCTILGSDLLTYPGISFPTITPTIVGTSMQFDAATPSTQQMVMNLPLIPAGNLLPTSDVNVNIRLYLLKVSSDHDPMLAFTDGNSTSFSGFTPADNGGGTHYKIDGNISGTNLSTTYTNNGSCNSSCAGYFTVDMTLDISSGVVTTIDSTFHYSYKRGSSFSYTQSYDPSTGINFILGKDNTTEIYQIDSMVIDCLPPPNIWTGALSNNWHQGLNWSTGMVPGPTDDVTIPNVSGASGIFPMGFANITVSDLTIDAGARLLLFPGVGLINNNGTITNNGLILLNADAAGTAWYDDFTFGGTLTGTGTVTAEQYVATGAAQGQRMFGSPVTNGQVSGLSQTYAGGSTGQIVMSNCASAQVDAGSPYTNLFEWHEDASSTNNCAYEAWFAISDATNLDEGRGYSGWMQQGSVISFTGSPNTGDVTYGGTLTNSGTGLVNKDGWHVLSNPYPSSININPITSAGWTSPQTYNAGTAYGGTFQAILPGDDIGVAQGFIAKVSTANDVTFTNAMRSQGSTTFKSNSDWYIAKLDIEVSNGTNKDISYIYFNDQASAGFDAQWDCEKRFSDAGIPTLYTSTTGLNTSLNGNSITQIGEYSFPMGLRPESNGTFTFEVSGMETFPPSTLIYLEDKATGTWTNLREQNTYAFNMTTAEAEDRFEIHFTKPITLAHEAESCEGNDGVIAIDFGNQSAGLQLQIWNYELRMSNQVVTSGNEADMLELVDLEPGDYEITFTNGNLQVTEWITIEDKVQVEAEFTPSATQLVVGEELNLSNISSGATSFEWAINGEFFSTNDLNYTFSAPGTYVVSLTASNADCEAFMEQSFIVNEKTTGITEQIELDKVLVYTKANNIVVDLSNADLKGQTDLEVYNALGQLLIQELDVEVIEEIEMANQARGYYFVNIINQQEQISKKVILK